MVSPSLPSSLTAEQQAAREKKVAAAVLNLVLNLNTMLESYSELVSSTDALYSTNYIPRVPNDNTKSKEQEIGEVVAAVAALLPNLPTISGSEVTDAVLALNPETAHLTVTDFENMLNGLLLIHTAFLGMQAVVRHGSAPDIQVE